MTEDQLNSIRRKRMLLAIVNASIKCEPEREQDLRAIRKRIMRRICALIAIAM